MAPNGSQPVLIISQFYWPEEIGSAPYVTDFAEWLAARGAQVTVLAARPHYPEYRVYEEYRNGAQDDEVRNGVRILRMPTPTFMGNGAAGRIFLESALALQAMLRLASGKVRRERRVISLCPSVLMVLAGRFAMRRGGHHVSIIHDIQSGLAEGLGMIHSGMLKRLMVFAERKILNRTTRLAVLTDAMRQTLEQQGVQRPIDVVPIWVDTELIRPLPRRTSGSPMVLYTGALGRKQGLDQLIGAARVLAGDAPEVRIVIRGRGGRKQALQEKTNRLGLTNVEFRDLVPREELNDCLGQADVHVVPQAPDGADFAVPSKVYGVMAAGRPFVATAEPGSSLARLQEQTGAFLCVPPNDDQAFAQAILRLVRSAEERERLGQRGRQHVVRNVSRDVVLPRLASHLGLQGLVTAGEIDIVASVG